MTVSELIESVLVMIQREVYSERPQREFYRDRRRLMQSVARYGYECRERGWDFEPDEIFRELAALLRQMSGHETDAYFPVYLEGAVDRHIRMRADELSERAKQNSRHCSAIVKRIRLGDVREPTAVEVLGTLYRDLSKPKPKAVRAPKQKEFKLA